nr:unnamed protein product [Trichobilharzia regenti]
MVMILSVFVDELIRVFICLPAFLIFYDCDHVVFSRYDTITCHLFLTVYNGLRQFKLQFTLLLTMRVISCAIFVLLTTAIWESVKGAKNEIEDICADNYFNATFFKIFLTFMEELLNILQKLCGIITEEHMKNSVDIMLSESLCLQNMADQLGYRIHTHSEYGANITSYLESA